MDNVLRIAPSPGEVSFRGAAIPVADIELGGLPRGAVLILCEEGELGPTAAEIGNRFAEHGYESTTAELAAADGADDSALAGALDVLLDHLARRGWTPDQVGVLGYGTAGRAALVAAARLPVGAAVTATGSLDDLVGGPSTEALPVTAPWLGMFTVAGEPEASRVRAFGTEVDAVSSAFTRVIEYSHGGGSFYRDSREPWEHAAAFDSWQRTVEWFNLRVVPRPTPLAQAWRARHDAA
jgi:carboxymethylenebutenolidase